MNNDHCPPRDSTEGMGDDESRSRRRDRSRWWEKADAWDPERWRAMATAWKSMWQEEAEAARPEPSAGTTTKTCPYCAEEIKAAALKCKHCGTWLVPPPEPFASLYDPARENTDFGPGSEYLLSRRLTRSRGEAMLCGVLGGLARYFGFDPTWLRIAYAVGTVFTALFPGIIVYALLVLIIPSDLSVKGQGLE